MTNTKASRFGKKAMSLFLSGAMVVAFAPALAAGNVGVAYADGEAAAETTATATQTALANVEAYQSETHTTGTDGNTTYTYDTTFTYGDSVTTPQFKMGDTLLTEGTDYTVKYYAQGSDGKYNMQTPLNTASSNAGTYLAVLTGTGSYTGSVDVYYTIDKLDITGGNATVTNNGGALKVDTCTANGVACASYVEISNITAAVDQGDKVDYTAKNEWTCTITPTKDAAANVTGTLTATFSNATEATIAWPSGINKTVDISVTDTTATGYNRIVLSQITVTGGSETLTTGAYTVQVQALDADGKVTGDVLTGDAASAAMTTPGNYQVSVVVDSAATGYAYKTPASNTQTVTVVAGSIKGAKLGNTAKGGTYTMSYDGTNFYPASKLSFYFDDGCTSAVTVPSGQYTVTIKKGDTTVDAIKDTGTYTVTVTDNAKAENTSAYALSSWTFTVEVEDVVVGYAELDTTGINMNSDNMLVYEGEPFKLSAKLYTSMGGTALSLPDGSYNLVLRKASTSFEGGNPSGVQTVDAVNGPGYYQLAVTEGNTSDGYKFEAAPMNFQVVEAAVEQQEQALTITTAKNLTVKRGKKSAKIKVSGAKTTLTYSKKSGSKYLTLSGKKIKVSKSAKKGKTYKIKVKVKAAASDAYKAASVTKTFKVTVK